MMWKIKRQHNSWVLSKAELFLSISSQIKQTWAKWNKSFDRDWFWIDGLLLKSSLMVFIPKWSSKLWWWTSSWSPASSWRQAAAAWTQVSKTEFMSWGKFLKHVNQMEPLHKKHTESIISLISFPSSVIPILRCETFKGREKHWWFGKGLIDNKKYYLIIIWYSKLLPHLSLLIV